MIHINSAIELIEFFSKNRMMNLFYELMHNFEILEIEHGFIKIAGKASSIAMTNELANSLLTFTGIKWRIEFVKKDMVVSFRDSLLQKLKNSEDWSRVVKKFPEAQVNDVYINKSDY